MWVPRMCFQNLTSNVCRTLAQAELAVKNLLGFWFSFFFSYKINISNLQLNYQLG